ncbi:3'-5' exonuclease [Kibdelosporangium lantanae]|uniref:3'-5' exonuclease n=1 Tax=Kibdelosporangium lantanae TaxID=1497396 RepID=A0ABW3MCP2_9PSEU
MLTVHSAKGLEWQVVAVPHVVVDVFPPKRRGSSWLRTVTELPAALRGDAADLPELRVSSDMNRKEVEEALTEHTEGFAERSLTEERRLFYVALTRSEHSLLVSGHWWGKTGSKPKGPSEFLAELPEVDKYIVDEWAPAPVEDEENPIANAARSAQWPVDPLGRRRQDVVDGAEQVRAEIALLRRGKPTAEDQLLLPLEDEDPDGWIRDTDVLLAERAEAMNKRVKVSRWCHRTVNCGRSARSTVKTLPFPGWGTGSSLILSGVLLLGMLVWSYRKANR